MNVLDLKPNTDEWLDARHLHFCASESPAMMSVSKFMSRNQLLELKKGKKSPTISTHQQKIFQRGHDSEDAARVHVELDILEDLPAVVGTIEIDGLKLLASYDGYIDQVLIWEHKLFNETLANNVENGVLADMYAYQLEHQMLVASMDEVLFTCSDGTAEKRFQMVYKSDPEKRAKLISGWKQFAIDLEAFEIKAKEEKVVAVKATLPVLSFDVTGSEITTNLQDVISVVQVLANEEMAKTLETDQDFADKDAINKSVAALRKGLKDKVSSVKSEFATYAEFESLAGDLDTILQKMESAGKAQVKNEKDRKKANIAKDGQKEIDDLIASCDAKIKPFGIELIIGPVRPDFVKMMKGKSSLKNIKDDVDAEIAKQNIFINEAMVRIVENQDYLKANAMDYSNLFTDAAQIINQDSEPFQAIVKTRIADEVQRLEEEREQIRIEEKAKAEKKAQADLDAKLAGEIEAHQINNKMMQVILEVVEKPKELSETKRFSYGAGGGQGLVETITKGGQTGTPAPIHYDQVETAKSEPLVDQSENEALVFITVSIPESKHKIFKDFIQNNFNCSFYEDTDDISIY